MSANSVKKKQNASDYGSINSRALQMIRDKGMQERQRVVEPLTQKKNAALDAYLNREDFQYDFNADALYHHYKDQYTRQGKAAMEDTMGQAAALTGGYGSSYAQNVGHQAYDAQLQKLSGHIPELYQMAYNRYRDKGNDLLDRYSRLAQEESAAYDRQYRQEQDAVSDYQWQQKYDYQKQQDEIANALAQKKLEQKNNTEEEPVSYDNGTVSRGNVKTMQRILGLPVTGYWGIAAYKAAGSKTAEEAWGEYQKGILQQRYSPATNPFKKEADQEGQGWTRVMPHTDVTRAFISSMPSPADFGGNQTAYRNYIVHQLDQAKDLTDEEKLTLAVYYGVREAFDPKAVG